MLLNICVFWERLYFTGPSKNALKYSIAVGDFYMYIYEIAWAIDKNENCEVLSYFDPKIEIYGSFYGLKLRFLKREFST